MPECPAYQSGFGNEFATEASAGRASRLARTAPLLP
jgi:hypothetical protein